MDDLAQSWQPLNHRKRKAECSADVKRKDSESKDPSSSQQEPSLVPSPSAAPRQPWLTQSSEWQAAAAAAAASSSGATSPLATEVLLNPAPSASAKRPRLEKIQTSLRTSRKSHTKRSPTKNAFLRPPRQGSDIEDLGVVSSADPGPSTGSLLELRTPKSPASFTPLSPSSASSLPIDVNSIYVPSLQPLINRQTLSELDLDVILRNPQLRHDLLFDPGLQFRPTCSRRKRIMSEKYWNAIVREVESGCTCVSFDARGKLQRTVCACSHLPQPPSSPVAAYSAPMNVITLRMPSRIRDLLSEFLEVLLLVIQPLSKVSGMYVNPNTFQSQMQEHEAQAEYIRSMFDPTLIEQELKHEVFDPSGLFAVIGTTLKGHCAPMRDAAVESMMKAAHACAPGGTGTKRDAVMALKMCMELLELMKLDIANHQLQTLRPFLLRTSGQFEYKAFKNRHESDSSLDATREWLRKAHEDLVKQDSVPLSSDYLTLSRNQQTYLSVLRGLVDLVFESQPPSSPSTPTTPDVTPSEESTSAKPRIFGRPETLYLDHARLSHLHGDSNDALAMQLHLLLYRQLSHSSSTSRQVKPSDLVKIKAEIRDIALGRLAYCLDREQPPSPTSSRSHTERLNAEKENRRDILLQIARRSQEARQPRSHTTDSPCSLPFSAPDESLVNLAQRWADSNMRMNSPLATLSQRRLRNVIFHYVVAMVYPTRHSSTHPITLESLTSSQVKTTATKLPPGIITPDLESITDEICSLGDKISRLALIHLDTYLPLYEQSNLLD